MHQRLSLHAARRTASAALWASLCALASAKPSKRGDLSRPTCRPHRLARPDGSPVRSMLPGGARVHKTTLSDAANTTAILAKEDEPGTWCGMGRRGSLNKHPGTSKWRSKGRLRLGRGGGHPPRGPKPVPKTRQLLSPALPAWLAPRSHMASRVSHEQSTDLLFFSCGRPTWAISLQIITVGSERRKFQTRESSTG
jgi:hypothetical protein